MGILNDPVLRRLIWLIPLGIAGNLVYTLLATDREALRASLTLEPVWLGVAFLMAVLPLVLNSLRVWRWGRLLQPGFSWRHALRTVLWSEVSAAVTPSVIGGAPVKVATLARYGLGTSGGVTMAALGSIEDFVFVALAVPTVASVTGLLPDFVAAVARSADATWPGRGLAVVAAVLVVIALIVYLVLKGPQGRRRRVRLRRWWLETRSYFVLIRRRGLGTFLGNLVLTAMQWSARMSVVAALAAGLGAAIEPLRAGLLSWVCFSGMILVPTPGAVGGAEAVFLLVFSREFPAGLAPLALACWRVVGFYGLTLLAIATLTVVPRRWFLGDD